MFPNFKQKKLLSPQITVHQAPPPTIWGAGPGPLGLESVNRDGAIGENYMKGGR